ncbi:MAG: hypothetical protein ACTS10_05100 [Kiloniellales bacterium]
MAWCAVAVTIDAQHLRETADIGAKLEKLGFKVEQVRPEIGAIFGAGDSELFPKAAEIAGVQEVREEGTVQLPPSDEDVPQ